MNKILKKIVDCTKCSYRKIVASATHFLFSKKGCLLLLALLAALNFPELAHADAKETAETTEQTVATMLNIFMDFLNMLLWPILIVIGDLMDTELILGPGMEERLLTIWVQVRNLVNVCFVLVLLAVALYNVMGFGGGEGEMAIKTALPKIALGLVLVNFTFVGGKIILDLTNVATTAMFALPEMAEGQSYDFSKTTEEFEHNVCGYWDEGSKDEEAHWAFYADPGEDAAKKKAIPFQTSLFCTLDGGDKAEYRFNPNLKEVLFSDLNSNNIGLIMAVNMGALSKYSVLKAEGIDDFSDLGISILFSMVMYMAFAASYVALGMVLLARIVVLWIALALSPIAVLIYVVPQVKEWAGGGGDIQQKVIKTLIAPVIIGATMSLGYLMISAWNDLTGGAGLAFSSAQVDEVFSTQFLASGINELPQFIIAFASIAIVWVGVFAAASNTYAGFATDMVKDFGQKVGGFIAKTPLYAQTLTVGTQADGKTPATMSVMQGLTAMDQYMDSYRSSSIAPGTLDAIAAKGGPLAGIVDKIRNFQSNDQVANEAISNAKSGFTPDVMDRMIKNILGKVDLSKKGASSIKSELERALREPDKNKALQIFRDTLAKADKEENAAALGISKEKLKELTTAVAGASITAPAKETRDTEPKKPETEPGKPPATAPDPVAVAKTAVDAVTATGVTATEAQITDAVTAVDALAGNSAHAAEAARLAPIVQRVAAEALSAAGATPTAAQKTAALTAATTSHKIATASGDSGHITAAKKTLDDANALP